MSEIDLSIYYPIPLLTTEGYISLLKSMLMVAPANPPDHVKEAIAALANAVTEAESLLVARLDENFSTGLERAFDTLVDQVWVELRQRLEFAAIYRHEGAAKFTDEDRIKLDLEERLEESRIAGMMLERMFANGVDFLRAPYPQQATHMAARLDWIDSKNFDEALEELVGPKLTALLKVCQQRYEAMVGERSSRDGKSVADFRELRNVLRRQLYGYCGAVGTLYKVGDAKSAEAVENALRPILVAREHARRKAAGLPEESEAVEGELDPLDQLDQFDQGEAPSEAEAPIDAAAEVA
jgi:hypothetical protein